MFFKPAKKIQQMNDQQLQERLDTLEAKLDDTGSGVDMLKMWNAVVIMGGVAVLGAVAGFTLVNLAVGLVVGVVGMASLRTTAEQMSTKLNNRRMREVNFLLAEQVTRKEALEQQLKRQLAQQEQDARDAPTKQEALARSIDKDFNEGLQKPLTASGPLTLKKSAPAPATAA